MELFNPRFLVRSATQDIRFRYLGHGTSRRGRFRKRQTIKKTEKSNSYENSIVHKLLSFFVYRALNIILTATEPNLIR